MGLGWDHEPTAEELRNAKIQCNATMDQEAAHLAEWWRSQSMGQKKCFILRLIGQEERTEDTEDIIIRLAFLGLNRIGIENEGLEGLS